ncbi:MAG: hypothetical protein HY293_01700 [Planctomycetes bacterium]|nr:hypothetical protein [Planctomycetota bacterium]
MIRHVWILFLAGCAGAATREEGPLDLLIAKSNAYTSFHLRGEITDGKQSVPVEMAFKAPDRALLKYGTVATTIQSGGVSHQFLRGSTYSLNYAEVIAELRARYPGLEIGRAPEAVFTLGDGVRALLSIGRLGARLGWLDDLRNYKAEGNVYRLGQTEIELREDGFIAKTSIAGHGSFLLKDVAINTPLPDSLFALPPLQGLQDASPRFRPDLVRGLDEAFHRWVLKVSTADETLETLIRTDLVRKYEPEKMAEISRESLRKSLAAFNVLHPHARPEVVRDKIQLEHGKAMATVDIMEEEIQKEYEKAIDGYFRGMAVPPPQKEMLDVARRWQAAVKRQVEEQIRRRLEAVYDQPPPRKD